MKVKVQTLDGKAGTDIDLNDDVFGVDPRAAIKGCEAIGIGVHRGERFCPDGLHRARPVEQDIGVHSGMARRLGERGSSRRLGW